jgi:hypothetical protein
MAAAGGNSRIILSQNCQIHYNKFFWIWTRNTPIQYRYMEGMPSQHYVTTIHKVLYVWCMQKWNHSDRGGGGVTPWAHVEAILCRSESMLLLLYRILVGWSWHAVSFTEQTPLLSAHCSNADVQRLANECTWKPEQNQGHKKNTPSGSNNFSHPYLWFTSVFTA